MSIVRPTFPAPIRPRLDNNNDDNDDNEDVEAQRPLLSPSRTAAQTPQPPQPQQQLNHDDSTTNNTRALSTKALCAVVVLCCLLLLFISPGRLLLILCYGSLSLIMFFGIGSVFVVYWKTHNVNLHQPTRVKSVAFFTSESSSFLTMGFYSGHVAVWKQQKENNNRSTSSSSSSSSSSSLTTKEESATTTDGGGGGDGDIKRWLVASSSNFSQEQQETKAVRACQFLPSRKLLITVSDDGHIRTFTLDGKKVHDVMAHEDYIRSIAIIHPTTTSCCFLSCSDDMTIKLWDLEYNFACLQVFEGHYHYVMQIKLAPKISRDNDGNEGQMFATASLDRNIKFWCLDQSQALFTLEHEKGVNTLDFVIPPNNHDDNNNNAHHHLPLLASGTDDWTICIWNYQTRCLLQTLHGHTDNVSQVLFFPSLGDVLFSTSEDSTVHVWSKSSKQKDGGGGGGDEEEVGDLLYQPLATWDYKDQGGRGWALAARTTHNNIQQLAIGMDHGCVCLDLQLKQDNTLKIIQQVDITKQMLQEERTPKVLPRTTIPFDSTTIRRKD